MGGGLLIISKSCRKNFYLIRHYLDLMPTVKDLMTKNVVTIDANKTVFEAAVLMSEKDIGDLIVMEEYSRWYCY